MKLKIPPAVVTVIIGGLMWGINRYLEIGEVAIPGNEFIADAVLAVGVVFGAGALIQFYKNSTTIDPHKPDKASRLVTSGIYRISRNPMYVALLLLLIAYGVMVQNVLTFLGLPIFVWYLNRFQIKPEEEVMIEKFGDEYREYQQRVRRWL